MILGRVRGFVRACGAVNFRGHLVVLRARRGTSCAGKGARNLVTGRMLLRKRVKVEIFLVVVVVVGGRVDKRNESAWMLDERWVRGFQKWAAVRQEVGREDCVREFGWGFPVYAQMGVAGCERKMRDV